MTARAIIEQEAELESPLRPDLRALMAYCLRFGGDPKEGFDGFQRPDFFASEVSPQLAAALMAVKPVSGATARLVPMRNCDCHENSKRLAARVKGKLMTGLALSHGIWRVHSWVQLRRGRILETTLPRELYLGVPVTDEIY